MEHIYVGRKNGEKTQGGIYHYLYNEETQKLSLLGLEDVLQGFTYIALTYNRTRLAATGQDSEGHDLLVGYQLDTPDKRLKRCGQVRVGTAGDICHLSVNRAGTLLLVTDFVDKAVHFYEFLPNGAPGAFLARVPFEGKSTGYRQGSSHPHSAYFSPDDRYALVADLGANTVWVLRCQPADNRFDLVGSWRAPDGYGPRHIAFHPNGKYVYVLMEITGHIAVLELHSNGQLTLIELIFAVSPAYETVEGSLNAADILVDMKGERLYASYRSVQEIDAFEIDRRTGKLSPLGYAPTRGMVRGLHWGRSGVLYALGEELPQVDGGVEVFSVEENGAAPLQSRAYIASPQAFNFVVY